MLLVDVESGTPYLVRFMIDAGHQRGGIGSRAVELLADELRGDSWGVLETSYLPVEEGAAGCWRRCGFRPTGGGLHGEPVVARRL